MTFLMSFISKHNPKSGITTILGLNVKISPTLTVISVGHGT